MQLIIKFNKGFRFLLCVIDIYSKYAWVIPLQLTMLYCNNALLFSAFQKILKESSRKPNKKWFNKGSEFYNKSMKKWLEKNGINMYSVHNEGKSVF